MDAREKPQPEAQEGDGMTDQPTAVAPPAQEKATFVPSAPMAPSIVEPPVKYSPKQIEETKARLQRFLSEARAKRLAAVAEEPASQLDLFSPKEQSQATPQDRRTGGAESE